MGQSISKRIATHLQRSSQVYEKRMAEDAVSEVRKKQAEAAARGAPGQYTDPSALVGGFQRGAGVGNEKERSQGEFLRRMQQPGGQSAGNGPEEMPEDLIKFLNDMGPLERKIDESMTSPRVLESLKADEKQRKEKSETRRRVRNMPMMEGADEITTSRTTNFSVKGEGEEEDADPTQLSLTNEELHNLLVQSAGEQGADGGAVGATAEAYVKSRFPGSTLTDEQRQMHIDKLDNLLRYNGVPVLMQDTDESYVGAWSDDVTDLLRMKLTLVESEGVRLSYEPDSTSVGDEFSGDFGEGDNRRTRGETATDAQSGAGEKLMGDDSSPPSSLSRPRRSGKTGTAAFLDEESRRMGKQRSLGEKNGTR